MPLPIDINKLRLQDSGELIEGLQRDSNPKSAIPNTAKVLKDHRDNFSTILRTLQQFSAQLLSLSSASPVSPNPTPTGLANISQQSLTSPTTAISSGVTSPTDGQLLLVEISQDATGSRAITWSAEFDPATTVNINPDPSTITRFTFIYYGALWHLVSYLVA